MKITIPKLTNPIYCEDNKPNLIIVENQELFSFLCSDLYNGYSGLDHESRIFYNDKRLNLKTQIDLHFNLFSIDINSQPVKKHIYKYMAKKVSTDYYYPMQNMCLSIEKFLEEILEGSDIPLEYDIDFGLINFFKIMQLQVNNHSLTFEEKLAEYFEIMNDISKVKVFILVNTSLFINEKELTNILREFELSEITVLLIEREEKELDLEITTYIIDDDLCEIY